MESRVVRGGVGVLLAIFLAWQAWGAVARLGTLVLQVNPVHWFKRATPEQILARGLGHLHPAYRAIGENTPQVATIIYALPDNRQIPPFTTPLHPRRAEVFCRRSRPLAAIRRDIQGATWLLDLSSGLGRHWQDDGVLVARGKAFSLWQLPPTDGRGE